MDNSSDKGILQILCFMENKIIKKKVYEKYMENINNNNNVRILIPKD